MEGKNIGEWVACIVKTGSKQVKIGIRFVLAKFTNFTHSKIFPCMVQNNHTCTVGYHITHNVSQEK